MGDVHLCVTARGESRRELCGREADMTSTRRSPLWKVLSRLLVALGMAATVMGWDTWPASRAVPVAMAADCSTWNLAVDFRARPYLNPNADSCGNFNVWGYSGSVYIPSQFPGNPPTLGVHTWGRFEIFPRSTQPPYVAMNATGRTLFIDERFDWPDGTVLLRPEGGQFQRPAVVSWTSPIAGTVRVAGGVRDLDPIDPIDGTGISWSVRMRDAVLASGAIGEGGAQLFSAVPNAAALENIVVKPGDTLSFLVDPNGGGSGADNTALDVVITALPGTGFQVGTTASGPLRMTWRGGALPGQAAWGLFVQRAFPSGFVPLAGLPLGATEYTHPGPFLPGADTPECHILAALTGQLGSLGNSDLLCAYPNLGTGTQPAELTLRLDQSTTARLTLRTPAIETGYAVLAVPASGPHRTVDSSIIAVPPELTREFTDETDGQVTCYVALVGAGENVLGNSDALCAVPGVATLGATGTTSTTRNTDATATRATRPVAQHADRALERARMAAERLPSRARVREAIERARHEPGQTPPRAQPIPRPQPKPRGP
jgi:hypothetical protein